MRFENRIKIKNKLFVLCRSWELEELFASRCSRRHKVAVINWDCASCWLRHRHTRPGLIAHSLSRIFPTLYTTFILLSNLFCQLSHFAFCLYKIMNVMNNSVQFLGHTMSLCQVGAPLIKLSGRMHTDAIAWIWWVSLIMHQNAQQKTNSFR